MASPSNGGFVYTENLLFGVATHISDLGLFFKCTFNTFLLRGFQDLELFYAHLTVHILHLSKVSLGKE